MWSRLSVVAYDGGDPARSGTLIVDVSIRDANDNAPRFPGNATFVATVDENVAVGTVVATLRAADADAGSNAAVSYSLSPETARDFGRTFGVRALTGELFTCADVTSGFRTTVTSFPVVASCAREVTSLSVSAPP